MNYNTSSWLISKHIAQKLWHKPAIILSALIEKSEENNWANDWFFYYTASQIEEEIWFKKKTSTRALNILKENNLIEVKIWWIPAKKYFRINETGIKNFFNY